MKKYVADFETTIPREDDANPSTRVWHWGVTEIGNPSYFAQGTDLDDFMDWCYYSYGNNIVYFHNLRFDAEFIIHHLFEAGYRHSEKKEAKTFNTLITRMGQFYSLEIIYEKKGKKVKKITFYDSLKKLPFKVEQIAKAFKLPMKKLDIDYKKERPPGYKPTKEEVDYLKNDVQIVAAALDIQFQQDLVKMTVASDAMHSFKDTLDTDFENEFPVLPLNVDDMIRKSYRGGFTYLNPKYANVDVGAGVVFDVNSLYPSVMYDRPLPHSMPIWYAGKYEPDPEYTLYIQELVCEFKLKPGKIPMLQVKGSRFQENEYLVSNVDASGNDEPERLHLTSVDLELFFEHYDVNMDTIEWVGGFMFREVTGIFKNYIDFWMGVKEANAKERNALFTLAKLMLNSLYGKFGSSADKTGKVPYPKDDGSVGYRIPKDDDGNEIKVFKDPIYTAMASFITAWARDKTIRTAQQVYDRFIYADTDSIHLVGSEFPKNIEVHNSHLGAWKHEGTFKRARFIRQKTYIEQFEGDFGTWDTGKTYRGKRALLYCPRPHVTCAGMPEQVKKKVSWRTFKIGFSSNGKLIPDHIKGGIVLRDSEFSIKPAKEVNKESVLMQWARKYDVDEIGDAVKRVGHIRTVPKGDPYYPEYQEIPLQVKRKYFRKNGIPMDVFADDIGWEINTLIDKLRWNK
jgi:hypothetical protein